MSDLVPSDLLEFLRTNSVAIAPQLHLIAWGLGILCVDPFVPATQKRPWGVGFALAGIVLASLHLFYGWDRGGPGFDDRITLDSFAQFFDIIFLVAALLAVLLSYRYLDIERAQHLEYYALILFAVSGMMFMAGALDLVTLFIGLELMSISTYVLVGFLRSQRRSNEAALKYFLVGAFSTGVLLYGMSLLYGITGSTRLETIGRAVGEMSDNGLLVVSVLMLASGFSFKIAAAPFHMWAPDAYEGAPTAITAFMSVAVKAAAFAVFLRVFLVAFADLRELYLVVLAVIAMATMTWGNLAAVTQSNVKRLLAYSSISHAGYIMMGLLAGSEFGVTASAVYLFAYTFMNLGIWAVVILLRRHDISGEQLEDFDGLFHKAPSIAVLMLIFLLSLAGIPPLGGFIAKYFVFAAVIQSALNGDTFSLLLTAVAVVGALNVVISLYYYLRIVVRMFFKTDYVPARLSYSFGLVFTLVVTVLLTIWVGVYPQPFIELARTASLPLI